MPISGDISTGVKGSGKVGSGVGIGSTITVIWDGTLIATPIWDGILIATPLFHMYFFPLLTHVNFLPFNEIEDPCFVQFAPAFTAASDAVIDSDEATTKTTVTNIRFIIREP